MMKFASLSCKTCKSLDKKLSESVDRPIAQFINQMRIQARCAATPLNASLMCLLFAVVRLTKKALVVSYRLWTRNKQDDLFNLHLNAEHYDIYLLYLDIIDILK